MNPKALQNIRTNLQQLQRVLGGVGDSVVPQQAEAAGSLTPEQDRYNHAVNLVKSWQAQGWSPVRQYADKDKYDPRTPDQTDAIRSITVPGGQMPSGIDSGVDFHYPVGMPGYPNLATADGSIPSSQPNVLQQAGQGINSVAQDIGAGAQQVGQALAHTIKSGIGNLQSTGIVPQAHADTLPPSGAVGQGKNEIWGNDVYFVPTSDSQDPTPTYLGPANTYIPDSRHFFSSPGHVPQGDVPAGAGQNVNFNPDGSRRLSTLSPLEQQIFNQHNK